MKLGKIRKGKNIGKSGRELPPEATMDWKGSV